MQLERRTALDGISAHGSDHGSDHGVLCWRDGASICGSVVASRLLSHGGHGGASLGGALPGHRA